MKPLLYMSALLCLAFGAQSQTTPLEQAILALDTLNQTVSPLRAETISESDLQYIDGVVRDNTALLDAVIASDTGAFREVARYFRTNFFYEQAYYLSMKGDNSEALDLFLSIEPEMAHFTEAAFPLNYLIEDKAYSIRWENFAPTQAEYNAGACELLYKNDDVEKALPFGQKALANPYIDNQLNALAGFWVADMKSKRMEYDSELVAAALSSLDAITLLELEARQSPEIEPIPLAISTILQTALLKEPSLADGGNTWVDAADFLKKTGSEAAYLDFGAAALKAGYANLDMCSQIAEAALANDDRATAYLALDKSVELVDDLDCTEMEKLSEQYLRLNDRSKADALKQKAEKCKHESQKNARDLSREGGLYLGAYIFPLFHKNLGLSVMIQTRKIMLEGSYLLINNKSDKLALFGAKENAQDWKGFYTHVSINGIKGGKNGIRGYTGALLGYNYREYDAILTNAYDNSTGTSYPNEVYRPTQKQYILMLNSGIHNNGRIFASDVFFSFGGAYNAFNRGGLEGSDFIWSNKLLDRKASYFSVIGRIGVSIGLQIGPKTFQH